MNKIEYYFNEKGVDLSKIPNPDGLPYKYVKPEGESYIEEYTSQEIIMAAVTEHAIYLLDYELRDKPEEDRYFYSSNKELEKMDEQEQKQLELEKKQAEIDKFKEIV